MQRRNQVAEGDRFTRTFQFQEDRLVNRPGWWIDLLHVMARYASYTTGAYTGTYEGLQQALAKKRIHVSYGAIRKAVDALQALGLLARDREANITGRRLMVVLRLSVKQSLSDLMGHVAKLVSSRLGSRFPQREKRTPGSSATGQRYQMPPSSALSDAKSSQQPEVSGTSVAALTAREALKALRAGFLRPAT